MRLKEIVQADKEVTSEGKWAEGKKMPKSKFPVSKNRGFKIGPKYRRRVDYFRCLGRDLKLLIAYRKDTEDYKALLGIDLGGDTRVLARLEYHGSHPGWHVHTHCSEISEIPDGRTTWPDQERLPKARGYHRQQKFDMDDAKARFIAYKHFGLLTESGDLLSEK